MQKSHRILVTAAMVAVVFAGGPATAAEEAAGQKDLKEYLCKDLMRMSGGERELALAFVHGYNLGKKNQTQYKVDALAAVTDNFIEHCLDNPGDKALAAFEKIAK